jgi:hypothetical protein
MALAIARRNEVGDRGDAIRFDDANHLQQDEPAERHHQRRPQVNRQESRCPKRQRGRRCRRKSTSCSTRPSTGRRSSDCRSASAPDRRACRPTRRPRTAGRGKATRRRSVPALRASSPPSRNAVRSAQAIKRNDQNPGSKRCRHKIIGMSKISLGRSNTDSTRIVEEHAAREESRDQSITCRVSCAASEPPRREKDGPRKRSACQAAPRANGHDMSRYPES